MKILIDARLYGLENAGLGRYTINLVRHLSKQDKTNNYTILLRNRYFNRLKLPSNWKKIEADFRHYSIAEQIKLPFILYREKPDLVHYLHFNVAIFYFGRYVVTIHDLLMHHFTGGEVTTLPKLLYYIRRLGYKIAFLKAIKGSALIITPSKAMKNGIIEEYEVKAEKITVTYEGVDDQIVKKEKGSRKVLDKYKIDRPYFFYVGNAYPHKNLECAIAAIGKVNKRKKNGVYFVIAGSRGEFKKRLEEKVGVVGAQKDIKLVGYISDEELSVLMSKSLAFVYPSFMEGFGLQGLEAMSSETLVLASDIPVFREVYKGAAIYFNPKKADLLADEMIKVVNMKENKREKLIEKGKSLVKLYSWKDTAKRTIGAYHSFCN